MRGRIGFFVASVVSTLGLPSDNRPELTAGFRDLKEMP